MIIRKKCIICGKTYEIEVKDEEYANWQSGMGVNKAFPDMDKNLRELLITGMCGSCFDKMFYQG